MLLRAPKINERTDRRSTTLDGPFRLRGFHAAW
jgi:hypothetical protein